MIYIEDAKSFFSTQNAKYDIIISEPSNPWVSGVSSLFTEEFYSVIKNYMNPDGLFVQWIHTYEIDIGLLLSVIKALSLQFDDYKIYAANDTDLIILASTEKIIENPDDIIFRDDAIANELNIIGISNLQDLNLRFLGDKKLFGPYMDNHVNSVNSDYFPVLDHQSPRTRYLGKQTLAIHGPRYFYLPILQIFYPWLEDVYYVDELQAKYLQTEMSINLSREIIQYIEGHSSQINNRIYQYYVDNLVNESGVCGQTVDEVLWVESILNVMIKTLPYLQPTENIKIYSAMALSCVEKMSSMQKHWLNLFLALSNRDKERIIKVTVDMLEGDIDLSSPQLRYVFSALFMSLIAANENDRALEAWSKYKAYAMESNTTISFTMAILLAIANQPSMKSELP